MLKKIIGVGLVMLFAISSANALASIGIFGAGLSAGGTTTIGYGLNVELPILPIPMVTSRVETYIVPASNYSLIPVLITASYKPPMMPIYFGAGTGVVIYSRSDANFSAPTVLNTNIFVGYEQSFMPMSSYFVQAGYEIMKIDYTLGAVSYSAEFSGVSVKSGVRIGI